MEKFEIIQTAIEKISADKIAEGEEFIKTWYPMRKYKRYKRSFSLSQKMKKFYADGFIDRYSGEKLVNPGALKVLSYYYPEAFPYHAHGKMDECHIAYWELIPTVDHVFPIALGGSDDDGNTVTTSMMHNLIKNNWTLEQLQWTLHAPGSIRDWDGLTKLFVQLVDSRPELLSDRYIGQYYRVSKNVVK